MRKTIVIALMIAGTALAQDKKAAITDPDKAGPDFRIQGEYEGEAGGAKWGAQVVALGDGKYDVYFLGGGLPGAGWDQKTRAKVPAQTEGEKVVLSGDAWKGGLEGGTLSARPADGAAVALKRVERKSPTLGAKPPAGAVVLFDGTNADEFKARNGKELQIANGCLNTWGTGGLDTKRRFGNVKLHVEFMLSYMPYARGQGRSNSGVYLAGRHEIQVLDSFGLEGRDNECGGLYSVRKPAVNMCLPPLVWQTYDIEYRLAAGGSGAKMTALHNGVKVQDDAEFKGKTTAAPNSEGADSPGPLHLQDHGNPVFYRNLWLVEAK
jgi:hypothetical protein